MGMVLKRLLSLKTIQIVSSGLIPVNAHYISFSWKIRGKKYDRPLEKSINIFFYFSNKTNVVGTQK